MNQVLNQGTLTCKTFHLSLISLNLLMKDLRQEACLLIFRKLENGTEDRYLS